MKNADYEALIALIVKLVSAEDSWRDKREALLDRCSDDDKMAVEEFTAWFEPSEAQ